MPRKYAIKSNNPTNALINRNFIIRILENPKENLNKGKSNKIRKKVR